jgi:hypothetical protein
MFSAPHLGIPGSMLAHRPGMTGETRRRVQLAQSSYAGLTRVSINLRKKHFEEDGLPGQARQ